MRLRYDPRAIQDLHDIRSYLTTHASEKAAENVRRHLQARANRLPTRPFIGIATEHSDIRILPPTQYPYRIYYTTSATRSLSCISVTQPAKHQATYPDA